MQSEVTQFSSSGSCRLHVSGPLEHEGPYDNRSQPKATMCRRLDPVGLMVPIMAAEERPLTVGIVV